MGARPGQPAWNASLLPSLRDLLKKLGRGGEGLFWGEAIQATGQFSNRISHLMRRIDCSPEML